MNKRSDIAGLCALLVGWFLLLVGQRVLVASEGMAKLCTTLAVVCLMASFVQRVLAFQQASVDRRSSAAVFLGLSSMSLLALVGYFATSDKGRELFKIEKAKLSGEDPFGSIVTIVWVTLCIASVVPSVLGEISRGAMQRAEKIESRRVIAAVAAGLSLGFAAVYGSLFTYAADQADKSVDFSYFRVSRPSESTKRMVESMSEPLEVLVFMPPTTEVRSQVLKYLEDLRAGRDDKLSISTHDFLGEPELAKEHKLTKDGVLVLSRGKASQKLDIGVDEDKAKGTLKKLDGEFQKVLIKAMRDRRVAYLTVGHGELNEDTDKRNARTVEGVRQLLESQNYQVKALGLGDGLGSEVPKDASVVLVLGPSNRLTDAEVATLQKYGEGGGKLFFALDPDGKADLGPLASIVGLEWKPEQVVHEVAQARLQGTAADKKILVAVTFSSHAAVSTLSKAGHGAPILFAGAAALDKHKEADKALLVDFAIKSMQGTFVDVNGNFELDSGSERRGISNLAAAVSRKLGEGKDAQEMRAFVLGDADAVSDFWFMQDRNNQLMFIEALRWLGGEESFSGEIHSEEDAPIVHTKADDQLYFYGSILGAPSLVLGLGFFFTLRGRKKPAAAERDDKANPAPRKVKRGVKNGAAVVEATAVDEPKATAEPDEKQKAKAEGDDADGDEADGDDAGGDEDEGAKADGAKSDGDEADGAKAGGAKSHGETGDGA
jgi:hypothetical protein